MALRIRPREDDAHRSSARAFQPTRSRFHNARNGGGATVVNADVLREYRAWPSPVTIVADGPYGVNGFPGDTPTPEWLSAWYRPHIEAWTQQATPMTTLWFWGTEVGWATVHPALRDNGWDYVGCNVWNKGIAHIAGNCNTKTLRHFPVVTEVCAQYVKPPRFRIGTKAASMKEWLRSEWQRSGLPLSATNEACHVKNAATRKYFTRCHLWYFPPAQAMADLVAYANKHGRDGGKPYFSIDGKNPVTAEQWSRMRSKFDLPPGLTNVWNEPALRGSERIKLPSGMAHPNQKPLELMKRIIAASSGIGDVVWEPFGGLCTGAAACLDLGRRCYSSEILPDYFRYAVARLASHGKATRDD